MEHGWNEKLECINALLIGEFRPMKIIQSTRYSLPSEYSCLYNSDQNLCFWPVDNTDPDDQNIYNLRKIIIQASLNDPSDYLKQKNPISWLEAMDELARLSENYLVLPLLTSRHDEDDLSEDDFSDPNFDDDMLEESES